MRYLNYARRSSDESSKKQVQSIEDQLHDTRRLARERGLEVIEELTESRSAKEPGRPVFDRMVQKIQRGEGDAILCWKLDRLTRNPIDAATLRWLMRQGKLLEIQTPHQIYRPEDNAVITAVESAMAEQYIIDLKKGVERGMRSKCEKGDFPLKAPSGYYNDRLNRSVAVDEERFALLRRAWELLLSGSYSVPRIHDILIDRWGYRSRVTAQTPDGRLTVSALYKIFNNPFYKGSFAFQGRIYTHGFRRMVTPDEWNLAQRVLNGRGPKKPVRYNHAFTGLMTCVSCGYAVTAEQAKGHTYYHCSNRLGLCTKKGMREEAIAQQIDETLESITLDPEFETLALEVLDQLRHQDEQREIAIQESQEKAAANLKRQQEALLSLYLQGHLTVEEFAAKKQELAHQATDLKLQSESGTHQADEILKNVVHYVTHAKTLFQSANAETRRAIAKHLGTYTFNNGELRIELHPLFEPVRSQWKNGPNDFTIIEPLENDSGKLKPDREGAVFQRWCTLVKEYRTLVLESNFSWQGASIWLSTEPSRTLTK